MDRGLTESLISSCFAVCRHAEMSKGTMGSIVSLRCQVGDQWDVVTRHLG
jgi:hypothetical protein